MRALLIAAGGGGDAVTAAALVRPLGLTTPPIVMSLAWDRLMIDPLPGPRTAQDFTGLRILRAGVREVVANTEPRAPAGSCLPRLAAELPIRILLLDPVGGVTDLAAQITAAATCFDADQLVIVDVGGDALTIGAGDTGLRSPLADQLVIAAAARTGLPGSLVIAGPGLDGELSRPVLHARLRALGARELPDVHRADIESVQHVFRWHPSEASGLLAAAAIGIRGRVEIRDAGDQIDLDAAALRVATVDAARAASITPARLLAEATTLVEAEQIIRTATGVSEIDYESRKAEKKRARPRAQLTTSAILDVVDRLAHDAHERGADFLTVRRLAEAAGIDTSAGYAAFAALLAQHRPENYQASVYRSDRPGAKRQEPGA